MAVGDFNGDGRPDMAVASLGGDAVYILLAGANGEFEKQEAYSAGLSPEGVIAADFNGDGVLDLAVAGFEGTMAVLLGNGDGTFGPTRIYNVLSGFGSFNVATADFNLDGFADLLVANGGNSCSLFLGNGDGTFKVARGVDCFSTGDSVAVADFNHDGKPDFVVSGGEFGEGAVLLGNGDGTLQSVVTYAVGSLGAQSIAVGDVNGDGIPDLAVANGNISVLLGDGTGRFGKPQQFPGANAESVVITLRR